MQIYRERWKPRTEYQKEFMPQITRSRSTNSSQSSGRLKSILILGFAVVNIIISGGFGHGGDIILFRFMGMVFGLGGVVFALLVALVGAPGWLRTWRRWIWGAALYWLIVAVLSVWRIAVS
jgi:hypothetical protein